MLPAVTAANYFDPDIEMAYMGSTQVKSFMACEEAAMARVQGRYRTPASQSMLVGSYVDAYYSGELPVFRAKHPQIFKRDGELKAEFQRSADIIGRMEEDDLYTLMMAGQKQVIRTGEIAGVPFKIKIDSLLDAETCREVVRKFPKMAEALGPCEGAIVDQKVMRDMENLWSEEEHQKVGFIQFWGYDIQGAIYQAVEGHMLPFFLAVGTREEPPDLRVVWLQDKHLSEKLLELEDMVPRFQAIKEGREKPRRCEKCAWCRATRRLDHAEYWPPEPGEDVAY